MRTRPLLELLRERDLPFEIVGGGSVPFSAPSVEPRQYCHIADNYLVLRRGRRWAVEFWDNGYVCQVVDECPEHGIETLYETIMRAGTWCPVMDHSQDQVDLFLVPEPEPAPVPPRRPVPQPAAARRRTTRQRAELWWRYARQNARAWCEAGLVRVAWLGVGTGCGLLLAGWTG